MKGLLLSLSEKVMCVALRKKTCYLTNNVQCYLYPIYYQTLSILQQHILADNNFKGVTKYRKGTLWARLQEIDTN